METRRRPVTATLTKDEEAVLARRIEAGLAARAALCGELRAPAGATPGDLEAVARDGREAFAELIERNLPLIGYVVNPIARSTGLEREDLDQEGMVGMLEAAWRFDPAKASFATCAIPWIRMRAWDEAVTVHGSLGLPARRARRWRRAVAAHAELTERLARTPTSEEVAEQAGESGAVVRSLLTFRPACRLGPDHDVPQPPLTADGEDAPDLGALLRRLTPVQRRILALRHGIDGHPELTTGEIAERLGCSPSTVRRYEQSALATLRALASGRLAA